MLLARYKCWRCNKTECSKRRAMTIYNQRRQREAIRGSITTYLQRWELNINDSVRKYYNRSDYFTGSRSNSKNTKLPPVRKRNNNPNRYKTQARG